MDAVLAVAFPTDCLLCKGELATAARLRICPACWAGLDAWRGPVCARCGLPFASSRALDSCVGECGACRNDDPAFDAARTFALYTGNLRRVILRLKFGEDERLGAFLGGLLVPAFASLPQLDEPASVLIVPVPLHPSRRRERGFNQSELLAEGLVRGLRKQGREAAPRIAKSCLRRTRLTAPQTGLSVGARRENLRGAFAVPNPNEVRGRVIVLVDDVMTTGATLSACARAMKRAGAPRVLGLALARATPQFPDLDVYCADNPVDVNGGESR